MMTGQRQLPKAYLRLDPNLDQTHPDPGAMVKLLCAAARQPQRGRFKSRAVLDNILGRASAKRALERHDVVPLPDGRLYVDGWDDWQEGDMTVAERQARIRARRAGGAVEPLASRDTGVTQPLPDPLRKRDPTPTSTSETRRRQDVETEDVGDGEKATLSPEQRSAPSSPTNGPLLSKEQLDAWTSFTAEWWSPFKRSWLDVLGLRWPPSGGPDDDPDVEHPSQRAMYSSIAQVRPNDLGDWILEANSRAPEVIGKYVLERWHAVRDAVVDPRPQGRRAASTNGLQHIAVGRP